MIRSSSTRTEPMGMPPSAKPSLASSMAAAKNSFMSSPGFGDGFDVTRIGLGSAPGPGKNPDPAQVHVHFEAGLNIEPAPLLPRQLDFESAAIIPPLQGQSHDGAGRADLLHGGQYSGTSMRGP